MLNQSTIINSTSSVVELLADLENIEINWSKLAKNQEFINQLTDRKSLNDALNLVMKALPRPDMSLQEAILLGCLVESQVADLYSWLSDLLEKQPEYRRLILYLPFEFLPNIEWLPESFELQKEINRFRAAYLSAWYKLLAVQDVRANFVDGDVLEIESRTGDLPRVVKAMHLLPKLIAVNLISLADVYDLLEINDNEIFYQSVNDAIDALPTKDTPIKESKVKQIDLATVEAIITQSLNNIAAEKYFGITSSREQWLKETKKQKLVENIGADICLAIVTNNFGINLAWQFTQASNFGRQAMIIGIRQAIEMVVKNNQISAQELYDQYAGLLIEFWSIGNTAVINELSKTFQHLYQLGIISEEIFTSFNLNIPKLSGPFSDNLSAMKNDIDYLQTVALAISTDQGLSQYLYPVILVFGSRLKGYGHANSDIDVAVFIKPKTSINNLENIQKLLVEIFDHNKIQGKVFQFWLESDGADLRVRDLNSPNSLIGESHCTYLLFGAVWLGDQVIISQLREQLIVPYFYNQNKELLRLYLESLERDILQYRLMHKGYQQFFPAVSDLETNSIDGQSYFWDSGYRQLAIKLFSQMVFIPQISQIKEKK